MAKQRDGNREDHSARHHKPSLWEWTAAGLGAAVALAAIGFMVYEAVSTAPDAIPVITARVERVVAHRSGYVVEFRATNDGDATAAQVLVQGSFGATPARLSAARRRSTSFPRVPGGGAGWSSGRIRGVGGWR